MRLYSFVNYYLSPLQHGLQTAHCVSEMAMTMTMEDQLFAIWADDHKTIIICNGGNSKMLEELYQTLARLGEALGLPVVNDTRFWATTGEGDKVIPDRYDYYDAEGVVMATFYEGSTGFELIKTIKSFRLA
jgi:hypothetical protein